MTASFDSGFVTRPYTLAALASLLLAAACSAPPGGEGDDEGVPEFGGGAQTPAAGFGGAASVPAPSAPGPANPASPAPAGASVTPGEQTGGNIDLAPAPAGSNANQSGSQSPGAGGSSMVGSDPSAGAAGSSSEPAGTAGSATMPPSDGSQQPPATDGNQQPPPEEQPPPAPNADCAGAFFCDGFEGVAAGASPDPALWSVMVNYSETQASANVQVSSGNARSGTRALRVEPAGRAGIFTTVPQSSYFLRAFMQIDSVSIGPVFVGAGSDGNRETRLRIQGQSFATINSVGSPNDDAVRPAAANSGNCADCVTLRANQWLCVEMSIDSNSSTATLWIDGVEAAVAGPEAFTPQPANPTLFFGSMDVQGGRTGVWIDDIAVGPTRIGCN